MNGMNGSLNKLIITLFKKLNSESSLLQYVIRNIELQLQILKCLTTNEITLISGK